MSLDLRDQKFSGRNKIKKLLITKEYFGLSKIDLLNYEVKERNPVCSLYRKYKVCGMGPPSSGAITINQILGIVL